eukprot:15446260-Alexandrium_andersonii.AAC.1
MHNGLGRSNLELHDPETASDLISTVLDGVHSAPPFLADAESANERGRRARQRCVSGRSRGAESPGRTHDYF